ncbi:mRNA 3 -end-processing rna-14 [Lecanosticta acicola]|uniref:mRNA 3'-end-processing protein RNA14 n=1 Tax=Lecanosticta acicola TaxID=111012 RepID=A0AAI9EB61_9PEZI|nr:mRNA 3 -end-processing rna-14 [Lecanosticta acicola]
MADDYDPMDPPTFNAEDDDNENEACDPAEYGNYAQEDGADDEDDDYDPTNLNFGENAQADAAPTEQPSAQTAQAPKQQTVAGFIVEDSDDEQDGDAPSPSQLNGSAGAQSGLGAEAVSAAKDVSLSSAPQDTAASSTSLNGSTTVVHVPTSTSSSVVPDSSLQPSAPDQGKAATPTVSATASFASTPQPAAAAAAAAAGSAAGSAAPTPAPAQRAARTNGPAAPLPTRLPHDKVGQLEDRIRDDPKGDTAAWLSLIDHYYAKGQYEYARDVYRRCLAVFPTAVTLWVKFLHMENELDERDSISRILNEVLMQVPNVDLWRFYLDHVRRALPLINDTDGRNRMEINKAFETTLDHVGIDPDSGSLWQEYIDFIKEYPGTAGGSSWQDLQKADLLRKAYQQAIKLPHSNTIKLWKEYEAFEMGLHKATGRKHIQEQSPHYVEARKAKTQLDQKLQGLDRTSMPRLPPIYGCAGEDEFGLQVEKFRAWIEWERDEDPLVYKGVEDDAWRKRVLYAYRQATMFLCFYPRIWFDAATWCFAQGLPNLTEEGEKFLEKGIERNPESVLLAMMKAERVESSLESGNTEEVLIRKGKKLDVPYEDVHTALYQLRTKLQEKDKRALQQIQDHYASLPPEEEPLQNQEDASDDASEKPKTRDEQMKAAIEAVKAASHAQLEVLKRTISYIWVAKMRAFRRVQGQGKPQKKGDDSKEFVKGFRGIFADARPRGPLSGDVYVASALMEWHCYKDPAANRIFDRGLKLFPTDENFILEYIKHLITTGDATNARVVFESTIPKIINNAQLSQEEKQNKCRPLFAYMHDYESKYGDLAQMLKIEKRMAELYPEEPDISRFCYRFSLPTFDAMDVQLLLSPTQAQPRSEVPQIAAPAQQAVPSVEQAMSPKVPEILLGPNGPYVASPKRPLDDSDAEAPQRKFQRGESPLKGAAGQRMQNNKPNAAAGVGGGGFATKTFVPNNVAAPPPFAPIPLPPAIDRILRDLPNAAAYGGQARFDPPKLMAFLPTVNVEHARARFNAGEPIRR